MLATVPYAVSASQQTDFASGSLLGPLRESKRSSGVNSRAMYRVNPQGRESNFLVHFPLR